MKLYRYRQNNSGGGHTGPAISVYIEADSADEANRIAEQTQDMYFDDDYEIDCECCGQRWYRADEHDACDIIDELGNDSWWAERTGIPAYVVIRKELANGNV